MHQVFKPDVEKCEGCGGQICTSCDQHIPEGRKGCHGCKADDALQLGWINREVYDALMSSLGRAEERLSGCSECTKGARACNPLCSSCEEVEAMNESAHERSHGAGR